MMSTSFSPAWTALPRAALLGLGLAWLAAGAHAQAVRAPIPAISAPMLATPPSAAPMPGAAVAAMPARPAPTPSAPAPLVGDVPTELPGRAPVVGAASRHLLAAQASGRVAAPAPPMYGATASAGWKRYVDSFSHPIPEFFESRVGKKASE